MEKICLVKQPAGAGDIFFCQKIAKIIQENTEYKKIIWPVAEEYSYFNEYMGNENLLFVKETEDFPQKSMFYSNITEVISNDNFMYVPLESASRVLGRCSCHNNPIADCHMKYNFMNMDHSDWDNYFSFTRNFEREKQLIDKIGIDINQPFNLINHNFGTYPDYKIRPIDHFINNSYQNLYMNFIPGARLFDWLGIFEKASEIHTIATSVGFILKKINVKNVYIYSKETPNDDFSYVKENWGEDWKYIS
jgi:hypothetical protein